MIHVESVGGGRTGRWECDRALLEDALARQPADARSAFYLAQTLRDLGRDRGDPALLALAREAYEHRGEMVAGLRPLPLPDDDLFVSPWIDRWGLLFEYSITSYWVGEPANCLRAMFTPAPFPR